MPGFTHLNEKSEAQMVNISEKEKTKRRAICTGFIKMKKETLDAIIANKITKGNVLSVARIAGIMAAKKTWDLIPLTHPISITSAGVKFEILDSGIQATAEIETMDRTGIEMESFTAVSVALLTIYDMCKSRDREMVIKEIKLEEKSGGRSGTYRRHPLTP
ncbi:cyclic pyranopterin monophosphate synthase MoaC [Candidatus Riflebacteria bacterium]